MDDLQPLVVDVKSPEAVDWERIPDVFGVYQLLNAASEILYIGKARSIRKRLQSHFRSSRPTLKQRRMLALTSKIQFISTHTEDEAFLLENQLIKKHCPFFNVLLKDDKSYPELFISQDDRHPGLYFHRGIKKRKGAYFGPFPSASVMRSNIQMLSKLFQVRTCEDTFYKNRSRPCLQYQTGFCSAPCVGRIDDQSYARDVKGLVDFLSGNIDQVSKSLGREMQVCSERLEFEQAGRIRDQIARIRAVQRRQFVSGLNDSVDWFLVFVQGVFVLVRVVFIRSGQILGSQDFYFRGEEDVLGFLGEFLGRFYWKRDLPKRIAYSGVNFSVHQCVVNEVAVFRDLPSSLVVDGKVLFDQVMIDQSLFDVKVAFKRHFGQHARFHAGLVDLGRFLGLDFLPDRIECFDVSHFQGEHVVASCVVFEGYQMKKSSYRLYRIKQASGGDDYGAMREAIHRRFKKGNCSYVPDLLLIDGGKGQVGVVNDSVRDLGLSVSVLGISKGKGRRRDHEKLVTSDFQEVLGSENLDILRLLQYIRDEAHRFAISNSRKGLLKKRSGSSILSIPGIGQKRFRSLIEHFGGLDVLKNASIYEISKVKGLSVKMGKVIYEYFNTKGNL